MKKYFIICLYILIIFTQLQAQELGKWIKKPITDKWGDTTGYMYAQTQVGTDSKNKYVCAFGFCCETEYEDISLKICSSIVTKFATWHPGRDYYSSNIYIKLREGEQIKTFIGTTSPAESTYDFLTIDMNKSDAIKIAKLLKENKTWDVLIEGNNWFNKTTITGNLPFNFDEENVIVISKDKKNVKGIKSWAKSTIKNINIPDGIEKIENSAFSNCTKLESITFPNSLKEIGSSFSIREGAFAGCKKLTKIFLPYSLTKIYSGTFSNCTSLESINFSNDSIEIEYGAFDNCKSLQRINLKNYVIQNNFLLHNNHIISILDLDLEECIIPKDTYLFPTTFYQCKNIKHIEIMSPTKIDNIDFSNMFQDSEQIESITLPKEVKLSNVPISVKIIRNTKR